LLSTATPAAGALVERTRAQGVVIGDGESRLLMEYVSDGVGSRRRRRDRVRRHRRDLSQGVRDRPRRVGREERPGVQRITIRPAVDFSALEDVLVVLAPASGAGG
jgi:hypothetical protein